MLRRSRLTPRPSGRLRRRLTQALGFISPLHLREGQFMKIIFVALVSLLCAGCASVYRQDGTSSSDPSKIAVIEADPCKDNQCLIVQEIDGKWRGPGWIKRYELLPGTRRLKLLFMAPGVRGRSAVLVEFNAQPGETYIIRENTNYSNMKWRPEVVDVANQQVVSKLIGTAIAY
jgi:hypothetical protein